MIQGYGQTWRLLDPLDSFNAPSHMLQLYEEVQIQRSTMFDIKVANCWQINFDGVSFNCFCQMNCKIDQYLFWSRKLWLKLWNLKMFTKLKKLFLPQRIDGNGRWCHECINISLEILLQSSKRWGKIASGVRSTSGAIVWTSPPEIVREDLL